MNNVAIVGLGYVGLPLCLEMARHGLHVLGIDIDPRKVELLAEGKSYIHHIQSSKILDALSSSRFVPSTDFSRVSDCQTVIICVPTPLGKNREPDLSFVLNTARSFGKFLQPGTLVILESTTYPGTTDSELRLVIEEESGLKAGETFHLAFSPEREDPGNPKGHLSNIPKVVGGYTETCAKRAKQIYENVVEQVVLVSNCRTAEATKLLENIFRSVNIALVNELKVVYDRMGIDIWEVIEAAKSKPFGFMPFYPGPGLGGHCIPIDPFYLTWKAREFGLSTRFIELAGEINTSMPQYVIQKLSESLNAKRKSMNGSQVLFIGLAYKPNLDDDRESPTYTLMDYCKSAGCGVAYFDPFVPQVKLTREHPQWYGLKSIAWNESAIRSFDAVVIATAHSNVDYAQLVEWAELIIDSRNATRAFLPNPKIVLA